MIAYAKEILSFSYENSRMTGIDYSTAFHSVKNDKKKILSLTLRNDRYLSLWNEQSEVIESKN